MNGIQIDLLFSPLGLGIGCCLPKRGNVDLYSVEQGMSKDDVYDILGMPTFKNVNLEDEEWNYRKSSCEGDGAEEGWFTVVFDTEGKVKCCKKHSHNTVCNVSY